MTNDEQDLRRVIASAYDFEPDYPDPGLLTRISADVVGRTETKPRLQWIGGVAAVVVAALVIATLIASPRIGRPSGPTVAAQPPQVREGGVVAILANNHLAYIPAGADKPKWDVSIAPAPDLSGSQGYSALGHRAAMGVGWTVIYALPAKTFTGGDSLVVVDSSSGRVIKTVALPNPDGSARYGALAVGISGDIWVVGSVQKHIEIVRVNHQTAVLTVWQGRDMSHWAPKGPVSGDFYIYEVQLSGDERRVYYSYSGGLLPSAGLDWADLNGGQAKMCVPSAPDKACIPGLAGFTVRGGEAFITSANDQPSGAVDEIGLDGTLRRHIELGLLPGFLDDFALSLDGRYAYLFGSCGYSGGMARLDLGTARSSVIVPAKGFGSTPAQKPCGESSAAVSGDLIALGYVGRSLLPASGGSGEILYVDTAGKVKRSVTVSAEPISVIAINGLVGPFAPSVATSPFTCPPGTHQTGGGTPGPNGNQWIACLGTSGG